MMYKRNKYFSCYKKRYIMENYLEHKEHEKEAQSVTLKNLLTRSHNFVCIKCSKSKKRHKKYIGIHRIQVLNL